MSRQYLHDPQFQVGFWRVARSVLIFLGAPLAAAVLTRAVGVSSGLQSSSAWPSCCLNQYLCNVHAARCFGFNFLASLPIRA